MELFTANLDLLYFLRACIMLEHLLTVESFVYFSWRNGVILHPSLPMNFIFKLSRVNAAVHWPITLISPDGQQQEVMARFF
jgi:hypothetical protein